MTRFVVSLGIAVAACLPACGRVTVHHAHPRITVPDPFARKTAALMWPGARRAFLVDGETLFNGEWAVSFHLWRDGHRVDPPTGVGYEGERPPCVLWQQGDSLFRSTASAVPLPTSEEPGTPFIVSLEFELSDSDSTPHDVRLEARLSRPAHYPFTAQDGMELASGALTWRARSSTDTAIALGPTEGPDSVLVVEGRVTPGEEKRWRFLLASHPVELRMLKRAKRSQHAQWKREATQTWEKRMARASRLALGEPVLERAVEQALFVLIACTEDDAERRRPIGSPFQYRDTWIRDAARQIAGLAEWGFDDDACDLALSLIDFQLVDGGFMSQRGQLDGTGQVLWALDQALGRASARSLPDSAVQAVLRAWQWCERERGLVGRMAPSFRGLMPPADPRDAELRMGYLVGTDCWTLAGYRSAAALLDGAGHTGEARAIRQSFRDYHDAFLQRLASMNGSDIPAAWRGRARDWGNFSAVYPCGVVAASDPKVYGLARRTWSVRGRIGLATYGSPDTLHSYIATDLASWALLSDQPTVWDSVMTDMLRWRTGTGGAPELFSVTSRDFGDNYPPHATAAAEFLATVRNGLLFDDLGDTLRLTMGTRKAWWNQSASLRGAPTRWGSVDLSFRLDARDARWEWTPVPVWTILRIPPGMHIVSMTDPTLRKRDPHTALAPPGTRTGTVRCAVD